MHVANDASEEGSHFIKPLQIMICKKLVSDTMVHGEISANTIPQKTTRKAQCTSSDYFSLISDHIILYTWTPRPFDNQGGCKRLEYGCYVQHPSFWSSLIICVHKLIFMEALASIGWNPEQSRLESWRDRRQSV